MHHLGEVSHYLNQNRHCLARKKRNEPKEKKNNEAEQRDLLKTKYLVSVYYVFLLYFCVLGIWLILNARKRMASAQDIHIFVVDVVGLFPMVFASATAIKSVHDVQDNMFLFRNEQTHVEERRRKNAFTEFHRTFCSYIWSKEMSFKI